MSARFSSILVLAAGLLGATTTYWALSRPPDPETTRTPETDTTSDTGSLTRRLDAGMEETIVSRPLFTAGRRLVQPADTAPEADVADLVLRGVMVSGSARAAMLQVGGSREFHTVRQGEKIGGWRLAEVRHDEVVFDKAGDRRTLKLPFTADQIAE